MERICSQSREKKTSEILLLKLFNVDIKRIIYILSKRIMKRILSFVICLSAALNIFADYGDAFIFGERILHVMQKSVSDKEKDIVRRQVALLYAQTENEDEGIAALMTIKNESEFIPAVISFTRIMAEKYKFDSALKTANLLKGEYKTEALLITAESMISSGRISDCASILSEAETSVGKFLEKYKKAKYLSSLSTMHYRLNNMPKALDLVSRALWEGQSVKDEDKKAFALKDVSLAYLAMNNRLITGLVENQINQNKNPRTLMEIAKDYLENSEKGGAGKFMKTAKAKAEKDSDVKMKSLMLYEAAVIYSQMDEDEKSLECALLSLKAAKTIPSRIERIKATIRANDILKEDSVYSLALQEMLLIDDYQLRVDMMVKISSGYMKMKNKEKGFFLLKMILGEIKKKKSLLKTNEVLEVISDIYIDNGASKECGDFISVLKRDFPEEPLIISKMHHANNDYKQSIKYAERINDANKRALQKIKIAEMVFSSTDKDFSRDILLKVLDEISISKSAIFKCILLSDISILCIKYGIPLDRESLSKLEKI